MSLSDRIEDGFSVALEHLTLEPTHQANTYPAGWICSCGARGSVPNTLAGHVCQTVRRGVNITITRRG